ncbi:MAG: hypothetical protein IJN13_00710 [Bacilli bacterium]|nr:hypothetical protein [Bacilli bacterium]
MYRRSVPKIGIIFYVCLLVIVEIFALFLMYKSSNNKNANLATVDLKGNIVNNDMFAIMLEQSDGTYKEDKSNTWPTDGYTYNASMSGCIDINGNKLDGVLTYDATNNIATVDTGNTSYCYLYFSMPNAGEYLLKNPTSGLNNITLEAGMYRYQGTDAMNYVCFGTTVKSECVGNTDAYMYRIIGIQENGQMKLIKKEALNSTVQWWSDYTTDVTWPNSLIYKHINDTENTNNYLKNTTYVPTGWESKIATTSWKYGDSTNSGNYDGPTIYATENAWTDTEPAKIGLWYLSDYYYAYASGGAPGSSSNAVTAWIHLSKNDTSAPSTSYEWTMSRCGYDDDYSSYGAWAVYSSGSLYSNYLYNALSVRPVFYLTSDIRITGGTGTIDDPFLIS